MSNNPYWKNLTSLQKQELRNYLQKTNELKENN